MKIAVILGTRPEIIKMSPVIKELERRGIDYLIIHTGQHYSYNLDEVFFKELGLPFPEYNVEVGSGTHAEETGKMLIGIERILKTEEPGLVLVEGDTNSVLAAALAASKLRIKVGHVEAGLRCYDREMPEETNRVITDHLSDFLFAPTEKSKANLIREGIDSRRVFVTGNTIVDAIHQNFPRCRDDVTSKLKLKREEYFLATIHREENVDRRDRLKNIIHGLELVSREFNMPVVYPIHPRAKKKMEEYRINPDGCVRLIEPLGYFDFLKLESAAKLVLTDSGGVQEETCILRVPCVTLRYTTERPETIEIGANTLAGTTPDTILAKTRFMLNKKKTWENPFGCGKAAVKIVDTITWTYDLSCN